MEFRPAATIDGRSAIELWDGAAHVATVYAQREGIALICSGTYTPENLELQLHAPAGVTFAIRQQ